MSTTSVQAKLYVDQGALGPSLIAQLNEELAAKGSAKALGETWQRDAAGLYIATDMAALHQAEGHPFDQLPISGATFDTPDGPVLTTDWREALASYEASQQPAEHSAE